MKLDPDGLAVDSFDTTAALSGADAGAAVATPLCTIPPTPCTVCLICGD